MGRLYRRVVSTIRECASTVSVRQSGGDLVRPLPSDHNPPLNFIGFSSFTSSYNVPVTDNNHSRG